MSDAGKGDRYRPVDPAKWAEGYARAFPGRADFVGKKTRRHRKAPTDKCQTPSAPQ